MNSALKTMVLFMVAVAGFHVSMAHHQYQVGDDKGWTTSVNYSTWAFSHNFTVGDTLVFQYDPAKHNVISVKRTEYDSCKVTGNEHVFSTGHDKIKLEKNGHYYFISNLTGNCEAGQKFTIRVTDPSKDKKSPPKPTPSPTPVSSPPPSPTEQVPMAPAPAPNTKNGGVTLSSLGVVGMAAVSFVALLVA
ncbi:hypothetical protein ACHQM5_005293 [Ranunculus cassubicifolius]